MSVLNYIEQKLDECLSEIQTRAMYDACLRGTAHSCRCERVIKFASPTGILCHLSSGQTSESLSKSQLD